MKILWIVVVFVVGFILGAGVGFKVLEGVSGDILTQAWDNSTAQFQNAYPGSAAQKAIEEQKQVLMDKLQNGMKDYVMQMLRGKISTGSVQ